MAFHLLAAGPQGGKGTELRLVYEQIVHQPEPIGNCPNDDHQQDAVDHHHGHQGFIGGSQQSGIVQQRFRGDGPGGTEGQGQGGKPGGIRRHHKNCHGHIIGQEEGNAAVNQSLEQPGAQQQPEPLEARFQGFLRGVLSSCQSQHRRGVAQPQAHEHQGLHQRKDGAESGQGGTGADVLQAAGFTDLAVQDELNHVDCQRRKGHNGRINQNHLFGVLPGFQPIGCLDF